MVECLYFNLRVDGLFNNNFVKKLNEKFKVTEIDENGCVWSLAIKGKRV